MIQYSNKETANQYSFIQSWLKSILMESGFD
jgi:hypothetical protein